MSDNKELAKIKISLTSKHARSSLEGIITPEQWGQIVAICDGQAPGAQAEPDTEEENNNYCLILTLLGMEEEGDPVTEVEELIKAADELDRLTTELAALREQVATQKDWVLVPREPERDRLVSMAIRYDHALGVPGYYDNPAFAHFGGVGHAKRLEGTIISMRQLYEEAIGQGFYPNNKAMIAAMSKGETK